MVAPRPKLHYAWTIAVVTFIALMVVAGARSASSVLFLPLEFGMGWSAATISIAVAINVILYGALGPFAAAAMERFGVRRMMLIALGVIACATAAGSTIRTPLQLVLTWGVGVGLGIGVISMVLVAVVATRWFTARRGLALGILTGASAAGQLVFLPLLAWIVQLVGWRGVGLSVAGAALIVAIPVAIFMRDRPEDLGLRPLGATGTAPPAEQKRQNPLARSFEVLGRAAHSRDFWLVGGTFFICGATTNGFIGTHFIALCGDVSIPEVRSAGLLATIGVFSLLGASTAGWLSDRYASRWLLFAFYGFRGLSLFVLPYALVGPASAAVLPVFVVFYGLDWLATGSPNLRALAEALGKEDAPIAYGWIGVFHQVGAGIMAFLVGVMRTDLGSYTSSFTLAGSLCVIAALAALGIGWRRTPLPRAPRASLVPG